MLGVQAGANAPLNEADPDRPGIGSYEALRDPYGSYWGTAHSASSLWNLPATDLAALPSVSELVWDWPH